MPRLNLLSLASGSSHHRALIEVHSHHEMSARFSAMDDEDESGGFRVFAVIGCHVTKPEMTIRVGLHGYFWPIPFCAVFEVPPCPART